MSRPLTGLALRPATRAGALPRYLSPASYTIQMTFDSGTVAPVEQVLYNPNNPLKMEWAGVFIRQF
ncbi:MAG: hypothetical protein JO252_06120 [Planctomycetaceae bacterium]|nr:hypothetical protein [Planctomycetaceae bacterium]MBV8381897.1 hypothetical protein [Planctomycetaceae bacterium]